MRAFFKDHLLLFLLTGILGAAIVLYPFSAETISISIFAGSAMPLLILDAGHGGLDGGAVSDGGVKESELNLAFVSAMDDLSAFLGIPSVLTRSSEDISYPDSAATIHAKKVADQKARIALINSHPDAVLISVHQNYYPSSKPSGFEVLYNGNPGSDKLGALIQEALTTHLDPENHRNARRVPDNIYLMRKAACTAVLVECGFLSNPAEETLLKTREYRLKFGMTVITALIKYYSGERL